NIEYYRFRLAFFQGEHRLRDAGAEHHFRRSGIEQCRLERDRLERIVFHDEHSSELALPFAGLLGATHLDSRRRSLPASPINGIEHRWVPPTVARGALQVLGINAVLAVYFATDGVGAGQHSLIVVQDTA